MTMPDWRGKRVTVLGLGIEGEDMARYFVRHGARVTVSAVDAVARRVEALERHRRAHPPRLQRTLRHRGR